MTTSRDRRTAAVAAAAPLDGVLSRADLRVLGFDSHAVAREVAADRWACHGIRTVATHTASLSLTANRWRAVWEVGCGAALDGVSALQAAGVRGLDDVLVHVSVPHTARPRPVEGVRIHRVTRTPDEVARSGLPRVRPVVAAIRAAGWSRTDRQAALVLVLPVQQRVIRAERLLAAAREMPIRSRRALVPRLAEDIAEGAHSLGELDFGTLCRRSGLPAPDRQVVLRSSRGRIYLDVRWADVGLVVEVDGAGHRWGVAVMDDVLRQNEVTISGEMVLRFDLVALRLAPDVVLQQVRAAFDILAARHAA